MQKCSLKRNSILLTMLFSLAFIMPAQAQNNGIGGYKAVKRLGGTSQSICRPAIQSGAELQSFARNQREDVLQILKDADWQGDPEVLLSAIEAGQFQEKVYPVGTRFEWMGMRKKGTPIASRKREWAGKQSFEGYELNVVSSCQNYQIIIPKACCNVSLVQSTPVEVTTPVVSVSKQDQLVTVKVNSNDGAPGARLIHPDGKSETLALENGSWTGELAPGSYRVEATNSNECGASAPIAYTFNVAPPVVAAPMGSDMNAPGGWFFAPFIGRQVRSIDPPLLGIQLGWANPINEKTDWFIQGGGSYNLDASELSMFVDIGIERKFGDKGGFFGGGLGLWDLNSSDDLPNSTSPRRDLSYFIQGGANTPWEFHNRPVQWFAEARMFDDFSDDIGNHNVLKLGLRYWY